MNIKNFVYSVPGYLIVVIMGFVLGLVVSAQPPAVAKASNYVIFGNLTLRDALLISVSSRNGLWPKDVVGIVDDIMSMR